MIEEDAKLQDEEQLLMAKVKSLQKKKQDELEKVGKNLYSVAELN